MAMPTPPIPPVTAQACGFSRSWEFWEFCLRSCCGSGKWDRMGMVWRRSPQPKVRLDPRLKLQISEDYDSCVSVGLKSSREKCAKPPNAKTFRLHLGSNVEKE